MPPAFVQRVHRWGRVARLGAVALAVGLLCGLGTTLVVVVAMLADIHIRLGH